MSHVWIRIAASAVASLAGVSAHAEEVMTVGLALGGGSAAIGARHAAEGGEPTQTTGHHLSLNYIELAGGLVVDEDDSYVAFTLAHDYIARGRRNGRDDPATLTSATGSAVGIRGGVRSRHLHLGGGLGLGVLQSSRYLGVADDPVEVATRSYGYLSGNVTAGLALYHSPSTILEVQARWDMRLMSQQPDASEGFGRLVAAPTLALGLSWVPSRWNGPLLGDEFDCAFNGMCRTRFGRGLYTAGKIYDGLNLLRLFTLLR